MKSLKLDFVIHWVWAIIFGLLSITGFTLMGAQFGWMMDYAVPLADYLHRTMASAFVVTLFLAMVIEGARFSVSGPPPGLPWLIIKKSGMGMFTLAVSLLLILTGIFLWVCHEFPHSVVVFAVVLHELLTFVSVPVMIWHIYDKAHGIPMNIGGDKNV